MPGEEADAPAVHIVELGTHDLEPGGRQHPLDHGERVVLEMLVADRVEAVHLEHRRHVRELADPDPVGRQGLRDVCDERRRALEVVEHRDARDDPGPAVGIPLGERGVGEEVADHVVALGHGVPRHVRGVHPEERHLSRSIDIPVEERAVVAADVDDEIARPKAAHGLGRQARDLVEVLGHRPVDPAAVPVRAVENRAGNGVAELEKATTLRVRRAVAPDELQRQSRLGEAILPRPSERPCDALVPEVHHRRKRRGAARAAR